MEETAYVKANKHRETWNVWVLENMEHTYLVNQAILAGSREQEMNDRNWDDTVIDFVD